MKLRDRVAVVTGGGSGIGAAICRAFSEEGATVAVGDLNREAAEQVAEEIRASGGKATAKVFDVSDRAAVERAADEVESELGPLSIWVNNAGVSYIVPFLDCTENQWESTLRINLTGAFIGCRTAISRMLPREQGVVLNMSSQSGKAGNSQYAAYCASKFGIIGLTQSLAMEFADRGIRVNALCPGVVMTPLWKAMVNDYAHKRNMKPEDVRPYMESKIPMHRLCEPEDVARYAVFLASDDSSYITGQAVNISGGSVMF
ncbi:MAG: SDR family oxidoreductase [Armatimonadetes bacterium]|nr:SDR family oxidoreductase [Armatimonadota bacterium]